MNLNITEIKKELNGIDFYFNEPLSKYTNTRTGGPADVLLFPKNIEELSRIIKYINKNNINLIVIGNASNLIVKDGGIRGFVLMLTKLNKIRICGNTLIAQSGALLIDVSHKAANSSLSGMEPLSGIPGSVGGAVFMNAGAYGSEMSDIVKSVEVMDMNGNLKTYGNSELKFNYRNSILQKTKEIIIQSTFLLKKNYRQVILDEMYNYSFLRASKQPLEYPSCGSVFKRPRGYFTGKLIHDANLQGFQIGGAQISKKHAGFIVNINNATASDYIDVIHYIQKVINEKFGVSLETEVRIIGED